MQLNRCSVAFVLVVSILALSGCGGGSKPAKQGGQAAPAQPAPAANVAPNAPGPVAVNGNVPQPAANEAPVEEPDPPGPDDFEIEPKELITEIAGTHRDPNMQPVELLPMPRQFNSSTFEIVKPADEQPNPAYPNGQAPPMYTKGPNPANVNSTATAAKTEESGAWALPEGATPVASAGVDAETGLPVRITMDRDRVEMVLIPPGVFIEGVDGRDANAAPQHTVLLESPYYIDVFEVTVARYGDFREFYRKNEGRKFDQPANHDGNPEAPAVGIKFLDAKFYAKWTGKELPTEAQWERAARGPSGYDYPWGNGRPIFHQARRPGQLDPVGTYPGDISPFGLTDVAGNAREWCLDIYSPDSFQKQVAQGGSPIRNPTGPKSFQGTRQQVVKGGKQDWSVWQRAGLAQNETAADVGFRCVLNIAPATDDDKKDKKDKGTTKSSKSSDKPKTKGETKPDKKKKDVGL